MKAVATCDKITFDDLFFFFVNDSDGRIFRVNVMDADVGCFKVKRLVVSQSRRYQILDDLVLCINPNTASARQFLDVQPMRLAIES